MFCDSNVDLGHEDNIFNMLSGNVDIFMSLGYFKEYDAFLDPYCIHLVDKPRKKLWNNFFAFSFDFSMLFALIKRALTSFALILFMFSYCNACEPHALEFDKLLSALMTSALNNWVLKK